jgi:hypothetical protein
LSEISSVPWLNMPGPDPAPGQYDLFHAREAPYSAGTAASPTQARALGTDQMTDDALCASIAAISLGQAAEILGEVARRRLVTALPPLAGLIRRFKGYLPRGPIIEQTAALQALVAIGGAAAAAVVRTAIERGEFNRANLATALRTAAQLGVRLEPSVVEAALGHEEAEIRVAACAFVSARPNLLALLVERLADPDEQIRIAAACALGNLGRVEARPILRSLLQTSPSIAIVEAAASVADDAMVVQLGRLAREQDCFHNQVVQALEDCGLALAAKIRGGLARPV